MLLIPNPPTHKSNCFYSEFAYLKSHLQPYILVAIKRILGCFCCRFLARGSACLWRSGPVAPSQGARLASREGSAAAGYVCGTRSLRKNNSNNNKKKQTKNTFPAPHDASHLAEPGQGEGLQRACLTGSSGQGCHS